LCPYFFQFSGEFGSNQIARHNVTARDLAHLAFGGNHAGTVVYHIQVFLTHVEENIQILQSLVQVVFRKAEPIQWRCIVMAMLLVFSGMAGRGNDDRAADC
jgi:hypothetical protein